MADACLPQGMGDADPARVEALTNTLSAKLDAYDRILSKQSCKQSSIDLRKHHFLHMADLIRHSSDSSSD